MFSSSFIGILSSNKRKVGSPPIDTPSQMLYTTYSSNPLFIYEPADYDASKEYPLAIFYGGQGVYGSPTVVSNQSLGTGNGATTTFTGNYTNGAGQDVLYCSVIKISQQKNCC